MNGREGFVLYKSFYRPVQHLSLEQKGKLFDAIYHYQLDGSVEVDDDIRVAFEFFRGQFERDDEKYEQKAGRLRENGRKGGTEKARRHSVASATEDVANIANAKNATEDVANVAYKDKDISISLYKEKDKRESQQSGNCCTHEGPEKVEDLPEVPPQRQAATPEKEKVPRKRKIFVPPTPEELEAYCRSEGLQLDTGRFIDYYTSVGWTVGRDRKMKDWKATARNWSRDNEKRKIERNGNNTGRRNQRTDAGSARWIDPKAGGDWSSDNITRIG